MSAGIANSFIFRESYFAEEVLQYQTPSCIDEDEDTNAASGIDYIRKYVEQLTTDAQSSSATTPAPNAGSPPSTSSSSSSPSPSLPSSAAASVTTAMTTTPTAPSASSAVSAAHAAIFSFNFASIQVPPSSNSSPTISTNNDSAAAQHDDSARLDSELDLPRYLSWFDEDALASDSDDDVIEEHGVVFYADEMADEEDDEINNDADGDLAMEEEEEPLFAGQQAQLQIFEVTKKYKQALSPDASLSSSPSAWSTALSLLAQHCALPIESPQYDTMKRKSSDVVPSEPEKNPKKFKRWSHQ